DPMAATLKGHWDRLGRDGIAQSLFGSGGLFLQYWQADETDLAVISEFLK
ncbi:MAG: hypothetical protein RL481_1067, partial [Pseudomonadota bacterium]